MFEVDPSIGMAGAAQRASYAAASNGRIAARYRDSMEAWRAHAKELEKRVEELELALTVERAHAGGMKAWKDAFKAAHPGSPVMSDSGRRFKDRDIKTMGRLAYEAEFDRIFGDARIPGRRAVEFRAD